MYYRQFKEVVPMTAIALQMQPYYAGLPYERLGWTGDISNARSGEATKLSEAAREAEQHWQERITATGKNSLGELHRTIGLLLHTYSLRDAQVAKRLGELYKDAEQEGEKILPSSLAQFGMFFLENPESGVPKITLTPDGSLRARWIQGAGNFFAIEFTGEPLVKLVAEVPRGADVTAQHFSSETIENVPAFALTIGASLA
jgi:hypothetical protein